MVSLYANKLDLHLANKRSDYRFGLAILVSHLDCDLAVSCLCLERNISIEVLLDRVVRHLNPFGRVHLR